MAPMAYYACWAARAWPRRGGSRPPQLSGWLRLLDLLRPLVMPARFFFISVEQTQTQR
jgi:hypothetical protein